MLQKKGWAALMLLWHALPAGMHMAPQHNCTIAAQEYKACLYHNQITVAGSK